MPGKQALGSGGKIELKKNNKQKKTIQQVKGKQSLILEKSNEKQKNKKQSKTQDKKQSKVQEQKKDKKDKKKKKEKEKQSKINPKDVQKQQVEQLETSANKKNKKKDTKNDKKDKAKDKSLKKQKSERNLKPNIKDQSIDREINTINNIQKSENKAKLSIQELIQQYKDAAQKLLFKNKGQDIQKQKQIQQKILKLKRQKRQRHRMLEELQKNKEQIEQSRIKQKLLDQQLEKHKSKQKKIQSIKTKLQSIQQNANERKKQYGKFISYVKQRREFVPLFKRYQKQFEDKKKAQEQSILQNLQEINKLYRPIDNKELQKFEQNYLLQKIQTQKYRLSKIRLENQMIKEENTKSDEKLWRGKCHQVVKLQLEDLQARKSACKEKEINRKDYGKSINQNNLKADSEENIQKAKQQPEDNNQPNLHIRQKYIKGVNYGLVSQIRKIPLSLQEKDELGKSYLQYLKEMNSHLKNKTIDDASLRKNRANQNQSELKDKSKTFKIKRKTNPYYLSDRGRNSLDLKDYQSIEYRLQKIKAVQSKRELQDKILRHGQHLDIFSIQDKKLEVSKIVVKEINQKLELLSEL